MTHGYANPRTPRIPSDEERADFERMIADDEPHVVIFESLNEDHRDHSLTVTVQIPARYNPDRMYRKQGLRVFGVSLDDIVTIERSEP